MEAVSETSKPEKPHEEDLTLEPTHNDVEYLNLEYKTADGNPIRNGFYGLHTLFCDFFEYFKFEKETLG